MDQKIMVNGLTVYPSWDRKVHKDPLEMTVWMEQPAFKVRPA
jgi:hypothetical protein